MKKSDLSGQSNNGKDYKKTKEGSLNDSFALNSMILEDVFTGSLQSPECGEILIKCLRNVQQKMNEMITLVKTTQESQIQGELHMSKLKNPWTLLALSLMNAKRTKSKKKKK